MTPREKRAVQLAYRRALKTVCKIGLPAKLLFLLTTGQLDAEIERAQAEIDQLNARLDEWEEANPEAASLAPWASTRQAWKDAGRPRAQWYEVIRWSVALSQRMPLQGKVLERQVHKFHVTQQRERNKLKRRRARGRSAAD